MWLILTAIAAFVTTILWFAWAPAERYKLGFLCLVYWGATLMWLVDHVISFLQEGGLFLEISWNGTALGVSALALGLLAWLARLLLPHSRGLSRVK